MADIINEKELDNVSGGMNYPGHANGSYIVYTVVPGDYLISIAERFGVSWQQIQQWNRIKDANRIEIGQKLTIYPTVLR